MPSAALAAVLTLWLLAGAEAKDACDPVGAVGRVASSCAAGVVSAGCCEALLAPVDLGGGVHCLCSGAAQPHLAVANLSSAKIAALFRACTGGLRGGGAHLPPACRQDRRMLGSTSVGAGCDDVRYGYQINHQCGDGGGAVKLECCEPVIATVDIDGCLCQVMNGSSMELSVESVLDLYLKCGGIRPLHGKTDCEEVKVGVPTSRDSNDPSARAADPAPATRDDDSEEVARQDFVIDVLQLTIILILVLCGVGFLLVRLFNRCRDQRMTAQQQAMERTMQNFMTRFLATSLQEHVNVSVREAVREMLPVGRTNRALLLGSTEMAARGLQQLVDDDEEEVHADGATAAKKRKAIQEEGNTSEIQHA